MMAVPKVQKYKCLNCCEEQVQVVTPSISISTGKYVLSDDLSKVFGSTLKCHQPFLDADAPKSVLCESCNSAFTKLSCSRNELINRTGNSSYINHVVNYNKLTEKHLFENVFDGDKRSNVLITYEKKEDEDECILPSPLILECQNSGPPLNTSNENLETQSVEYEEKNLELIMKKVECANASHVPKSLKHNFSCIVCKRKFYTNELRENHMKSAHQVPTKSFACQLCDKAFMHNWFYRNHLKTIHNGIELKFTCTLCGENYLNRSDFNLHMNMHMPFKCNHCEASFGTIGGTDGIQPLREHLLEFHADSWEAKAAKYNAEEETQENKLRSKRQCPTCRVRFENGNELNSHVLFDHYNRKVCEGCEIEFSSSKELSIHLHKTGHLLKTCNQCPKKTLSSMQLLIKHMDAVHTTEQNNYSLHCEVCGGGFRIYSHLLIHYGRHIQKIRKSASRKYICDQCDNSFLDNEALKQHIDISHGNSEVSSETNNSSQKLTPTTASFKCKICNLVFATKKSLMVHCRASYSHGKPVINTTNHRMKKNLSQEESEYVFLSHDDPDKKFQCKVCKKGFINADKCFRHLCNVHSIYFRSHQRKTLRPPKDKSDCVCKICHKTFTISGLPDHMKRHALSNSSQVQDRSKSMKCNLCPEIIIGTIMDMRNHFFKIHPETTEAKSAKINIQRLKDDNMQRRKDDSQAGKIYGEENKCSICNKVFASIVEKDKHDEIFHKLKISCHFCDKTFSTEPSCRKHETECHSEYPCKHCRKVLTSPENFHQHFLEEHSRLPYICEVCGTHFAFPIPIIHYAKHFGIDNGCKTKFPTEKLLSDHRKNCQQIRKTYKCYGTKCHLCGKKFKSKRLASFQDHFIKVHKLFASYECEECGRLFFEIESLTTHLKQVHRHINYTSAISKYMNKNETLKALRYSVADKKYKCAHCDSLFSLVWTFNKHMRKKHPPGNSSNTTGNSKTLPARKRKKRIVWTDSDSDSMSSEEDTDLSMTSSDSD